MSAPAADAWWPRPGDDQVVAADRCADRVVARAVRVFPAGVPVGYAQDMPTSDGYPWAWHWLEGAGRARCGVAVVESTVRCAGGEGSMLLPSGGSIGSVDCDRCAAVLVADPDPQVRAAAAVVANPSDAGVAAAMLEMLADLAVSPGGDALTVTALLDTPVGMGARDAPGVRSALVRLSGHADARVRAVLAWSAWADVDVLRVLAGDADAAVRDAVTQRLLVSATRE